MGEVYRAEDLTLGQTVALKFLRAEFSTDPMWLARFLGEVRVARQVTHPNVCRVFDIAEAAGEHFLTMEYVDGEDLATLLRRIGRLPTDKALDIARQLCAGLGAAHAAGVLHRDLKPANIMLDGRGQVRVTDFGLAGLRKDITEREIRAGTPAYMSPEQISGQDVSEKSDLYALGLVLYELFTGKPAFEADDVAGYREHHRKSKPTPPSQHIQDVPPDVEKVILRCLDKDPKDRPDSALAVAAALSGGDMLAAALAAGRMPTPDMVARGTLPRPVVSNPVTWLVVTVALLAGFLWVRKAAPLPWDRANAMPPSVLVECARDLVRAAGYPTDEIDHAYGFCTAAEAQALARGYIDPREPGLRLRTGGDELVFWYRQSPQPLVPSEAINVVFGDAQVTPTDPASLAAGHVSVAFDAAGRLLLFAAIPESNAPSSDGGGNPANAETWVTFLERAEARQADLHPAVPSVTSFFTVDSAMAWHGESSDSPGRLWRIDTLSSGGRPQFFAVRERGQTAASRGAVSPQWRKSIADTSSRLILLALTLVALPWAWRNLRRGQGDRHGAFRLAILVVGLKMIVWFLHARHAPVVEAEFFLLCLAGMRAVSEGLLVWMFYIALEPVVRRYWPHMLISWTRALNGRFGDPLVGFHGLAGVALGIYLPLVVGGERLLVERLGWEIRPHLFDLEVVRTVLGGRHAVAGCLNAFYLAVARGLVFLLFMAALRALLKKPAPAAVVAVLLLAPAFVPYGAHHLTSWFAIGVGCVAVSVWAMTRMGLVTFVVAMFVSLLLIRFPIHLDPQYWQADVTLLILAIVLTLTVLSFMAARSRAAA